MNWPAPAPVEPTDTEPTWLRRHWVGVLIAAGGIIVAVSAVAQGGIWQRTDPDDQRYRAHAACAEFTRDRLQAPSTADFPEYDDAGVTVTGSGDRWVVRSFVDSRNRLGVEARTRFRCDVQDIGSRWQLVDWSER
jgi:hypothetical protein